MKKKFRQGKKSALSQTKLEEARKLEEEKMIVNQSTKLQEEPNKRLLTFLKAHCNSETTSRQLISALIEGE